MPIRFVLGLCAVLLFAGPASAETAGNAFTPSPTTANIAATNSTSNVQLTGTGSNVEVYNSGSVTVFLAFGTTSAVTSSASTGYPIPPGVDKIIGLSQEIRWIAAITGSGTATVYFTPGEGI